MSAIIPHLPFPDNIILAPSPVTYARKLYSGVILRFGTPGKQSSGLFSVENGRQPRGQRSEVNDDPSKSMIWVTDHMHKMQGSVLQHDT